MTASSGSASWRSVLVRVAVEPATLKSHPSGSCWVVITQGVEGNNSAPAPSSRITTSGVTPRSVHWRLNASASGAVMKRSLPTVLSWRVAATVAATTRRGVNRRFITQARSTADTSGASPVMDSGLTSSRLTRSTPPRAMPSGSNAGHRVGA
ncbi:hypothetical protein EB73_34685 [Mycobacterium sp. SWH-M3]|nr:hypothetical protein EB73_34685 [Mycobacterium sp. SWH-M3]